MKRIPKVLIAALAIELGFFLFELGGQLFGSPEWILSPRWRLGESGADLASLVLFAVGYLAFARGLTGGRRTGALVSVAGSFVALGLTATWLVFEAIQLDYEKMKPIFAVTEYLWAAVPLLIACGLAAAAGRERLRITIPLVVATVCVHPPPLLANVLWGWISSEHGRYLYEVLGLAGLGIRIALIALASHDRTEVPDVQRASRGLERAARAIWLRLIAAVVLTGLTLLAAMGGAGMLGALKLALISSAIINIVAMVQLAIGAIGAAVAEAPDLPRLPLFVGGALSLWTAGALLAQLPYIYRAMYGSGSDEFGFGHDAQDFLMAFSVVIPVVAAFAMVAIGLAISSFANRRAAPGLQHQASGAVPGFIGLMIASIAITSWLLQSADSQGTFILFSLAAVVAGIWGWVLMARLYSAGASEMVLEPGLPTARLENG